MAEDYNQRSTEELVKLLEDRDNTINSIKQQAKSFLERLKAQHQEEIDRLKEELSGGQDDEIKRLQEIEVNLRADVESKEIQLAKVQEDAKKYVAVLRKKEQDATDALRIAQDELESLRNEMEGLKRHASLNLETDALREEVASLKASLESCEEESSKVKKQAKRVVEQMTERNKELQMTLASQEDLVQELKLKIQNLEEEMAAAACQTSSEPTSCTHCETLAATSEQLRLEIQEIILAHGNQQEKLKNELQDSQTSLVQIQKERDDMEQELRSLQEQSSGQQMEHAAVTETMRARIEELERQVETLQASTEEQASAVEKLEDFKTSNSSEVQSDSLQNVYSSNQEMGIFENIEQVCSIIDALLHQSQASAAELLEDLERVKVNSRRVEEAKLEGVEQANDTGMSGEQGEQDKENGRRTGSHFGEETLRAEMEKLLQALKESDCQRGEVEQELRSLQEQSSGQQMEHAAVTETMRARIEELERQVETLQASMEEQASAVEKLEAEKRVAEEQLASSMQEAMRAKEQLESIKAKAKETIETAKEREAKTKASMEDKELKLKTEIEQLTEKLLAVEAEGREAESKIQTLTADLEGWKEKARKAEEAKTGSTEQANDTGTSGEPGEQEQEQGQGQQREQEEQEQDESARGTSSASVIEEQHDMSEQGSETGNDAETMRVDMKSELQALWQENKDLKTQLDRVRSQAKKTVEVEREREAKEKAEMIEKEERMSAERAYLINQVAELNSLKAVLEQERDLARKELTAVQDSHETTAGDGEGMQKLQEECKQLMEELADEKNRMERYKAEYKKTVQRYKESQEAMQGENEVLREENTRLKEEMSRAKEKEGDASAVDVDAEQAKEDMKLEDEKVEDKEEVEGSMANGQEKAAEVEEGGVAAPPASLSQSEVEEMMAEYRKLQVTFDKERGKWDYDCTSLRVQLKEQLEKTKEAEQELEDNKKSMAKVRQEAQKMTDHLKSQLGASEEMEQKLKEQVKELSESNEKLEEKVKLVGEELEAVRQQLDKSLSENEASRAEVATLLEKLDMRQKEQDGGLQAELEALQQRMEEKSDKYKKLKESHETLKTACARAVGDHKKTKEVNEQLKERVEELEKRLMIEATALQRSSGSMSELEALEDLMRTATLSTASEPTDATREKEKAEDEATVEGREGASSSDLQLVSSTDSLEEKETNLDDYRRRARAMLQDKDEQIAELRSKLRAALSRTGSGWGGGENGSPAASKQKESMLERQNAELFREMEEIESKYKLQVDILKQEVALLSQELKRQSVPQEYLKEVIVRFILSSPQLGVGPQEHEALIPVLADLLAFSSSDRERIANAQSKAKSGLFSSAANFLFS